MHTPRLIGLIGLIALASAPLPVHADPAPQAEAAPTTKKGRTPPQARPAAPSSGSRPAEARPAEPREPEDPQRPVGVPDRAPAEGPARSPAGPAPVVKAAAPAVRREAVARPEVSTPPEHARTSADGRRSGPPPAARGSDHRYARPGPHAHRTHPDAHHPPPARAWYRGWYHHWWVHPWYRWTHATVAFVWFDFVVDPWAEAWAPPPRAGWVWVPGYRFEGHWIPGHWRPVATPPPPRGAAWVWVPGWWMGPVYVEGYWRVDRRADGDWAWVDGAWLSDGTYVWGHWVPAEVREGYVWEPGFWDGETWVEGFWRPEARAGYVWVSARFGDDGVYRAGYWEPVEARPGSVWVPGWFDGESWQPGYWVDEAQYRATDPGRYTPAEGWDEGYEAPAGEGEEGDGPIAIPAG